MSEKNAWTLTGNAETNPATDFLGTQDNQPLVIKTHGVEVVHINPGRLVDTNGYTRIGGNVGVGTQTPNAQLHISSAGGFNSPQVEITQTTPFEFARLRFLTFGRDLVDGGRTSVSWDIAQGNGRLNFFEQNAGNILTLSTLFVQEVGAFAPRIGIATENPETTLHVNGTARVSVLEITGGADLAESFPVAGETDIDAGTVMVIDDHHPGHLRISSAAYDRKVAGVVSGAGRMSPGITLQQSASERTRVALNGRVYCKATAITEAIKPGDLLTTSDVPGHCMKATDNGASCGAILGKAMSPLEKGSGLVLVLVNLH